MQLYNLENESRHIKQSAGNFSVLEYDRDPSVNVFNAQTAYFMSEMNVRRRQVIVRLNGTNSAMIQAGAMHWMLGDVKVTTGVKGAGDFVGKMFKGVVTKESAIKPEYVGDGYLVLEPTYKYILLEDLSKWPDGLTIEDGMFYACDGGTKLNLTHMKNVSSTVLGKEGFFNLSLRGSGIAALESNVPSEELVRVDLNNETLKIDGNLAMCWSSGLEFTVERTTKTLIGSAASGEGLVNVYRGTGTVLMSPISATSSLFASTSDMSAKSAAKSSNTVFGSKQ